MKRITDHIRGRLLLGVIEQLPDLISLRRSEWSNRFERLMRNRLLMGAYRYGLMHAQGKSEYDRCADINRRIDLYTESGNLEHLVDAANLAMLEFEEGRHPQRHMAASDDKIHTKESK